MIKVRFNDAAEFVAELRRDAALVSRGIVRLTYRFRSEATAPMRSTTVLASAVIDGRVVVLEECCGSYFFGTDEAVKVNDTARAKAKQVEDAARELNLEVRPGVFEAA